MILIIEDNPNIRQELSGYLLANGHPCVCPEDYFCTQENLFADVSNLLDTCPIELILLDINLESCDGLKLCRDIRSISSVPVIFVTGRTNDKDELSGILMGGDDFIRKPYSLPILLARINRILTRQNQAPSEAIYASGVSLNVLMGQLTWKGATMDLSKNEVKILYYLFLNKGHVVTKDSLIEYLWENKFYVDENILNVNLSRLRRRLKDLGVGNLIITIPKKGLMVQADE
ncbi:MAG: response regulator transcription factor [Eubacteriales bacterium]|nr:response regulator transcription factor [Eubacteriales bacterium]